MNDGVVLSVNGGSSSLKLALFEVAPGREELLARGTAERSSRGAYQLVMGERAATAESQPDALRLFAQLAGEARLPAPSAIGHRLVHGGREFQHATALDEQALERIRALIPLAPLHLPLEIELIETAGAVYPDATQWGCFDTAFHRAMPELAQRLPLPRELHDRGVQRYGFHGLSYAYVLQALGEQARGRLVIAHLGGGSSLAAVRDSCPIDTTMGLTPSGGLMMAARSGDLDPGVLVHLLRHEGYDAEGLDRLINHESGLAGVSGKAGDMRALLSLAPTIPAAEQAVEMYCRIAQKQIAAMAASLGGIDQLVFTAGIGENSPEVRARICSGLGFLGLHLDPERNARNAAVISPAPYYRTVRVVPTDEERMVARLTAEQCGEQPGSG